jgi:ubiquitin carboxyl-terminal hydrolase 25/28
LLADLFNNLISAPTNSIRPERELAYLALVTSQDENESSSSKPAEPKEEKEPEAAASALIESKDDPMDLDMPEVKTASPTRRQTTSPTPSVLGKRTNDHLDQLPDVKDMDISSTPSGSDSYIMVSPPQEPPSEVTSPSRGSKENPINVEEDGPVYGPFLPSDAPPLPPRKRHNSTRLEPAAGEMMFGRQHDVSECMDNVMFQIEAALDPALVRTRFGTETPVQECVAGFLTLEAQIGQRAVCFTAELCKRFLSKTKAYQIEPRKRPSPTY